MDEMYFITPSWKENISWFIVARLVRCNVLIFAPLEIDEVPVGHSELKRRKMHKFWFTLKARHKELSPRIVLAFKKPHCLELGILSRDVCVMVIRRWNKWKIKQNCRNSKFLSHFILPQLLIEFLNVYCKWNGWKLEQSDNLITNHQFVSFSYCSTCNNLPTTRKPRSSL